MSLSPLAYADSLRIGSIEFVSPDEVRVQLDTEAPDHVALNTGTPRPFPRINGYVLIPCDEGYLVAQVGWLTIERSQYPKRRGLQDFGLVDLPYPLRKMSLNPMGVLSVEYRKDDSEETYRFHRGVESYPTVGDPVLVPTQTQLRAIVESGAHRHVLIGHSPLAANAEVKIDPDRLFSRHLAILGNTGSGKSCSVAGLIRWSLEAARKEKNGIQPNARFIVLDPNGEYSKTFDDLGDVRVFSVEPIDSKRQLQVPLWLWDTQEWTTFTKASSKTQRPALTQALKAVRDGTLISETVPRAKMRRYLRGLISTAKCEYDSGTPWGSFPKNKSFYEMIKAWQTGIKEQTDYTDDQNSSLREVVDFLDQLFLQHEGKYTNYIIDAPAVNQLIELLDIAHAAFGGSEKDVLPISADVPRPFTGDQLLRSVESSAEVLNVSEHIDTMLARIQTLLADARLKVVSSGAENVSLEQWLIDYIGDNRAVNGSISIIDLSLVPAEVTHIITAVIARVTLEALQRYRKLHQGETLPTVLVMEEAHLFIKRYQDDSDDQSASRLCTQVFEKIAREGRKFGLGLVLSSQRPSELSPTVLSQCNSFLLHRISNDRDQDLVSKLLPDNLHGLMRDLPVLPARQAILLGWASELPVLVEMNELPEEQQPQSTDPDYWSVWTGKDENGNEVKRDVDWKTIADDWQQQTVTTGIDAEGDE
jgi:DNA helicase HerA-like ATPase